MTPSGSTWEVVTQDVVVRLSAERPGSAGPFRAGGSETPATRITAFR